MMVSVQQNSLPNIKTSPSQKDEQSSIKDTFHRKLDRVQASLLSIFQTLLAVSKGESSQKVVEQVEQFVHLQDELKQALKQRMSTFIAL
jgi:hypothetical protein